MMVYRNGRQRVATAEVVDRIEAASGFERQMEAGELEAGVADALCPERDGPHPVLRALRSGRWRGHDLPREIEISKPEGFAYYALDPELYRLATRLFAAERQPTRVMVIGIRSIGTTLASVVESELRSLGITTESWTVRPRGHPWNRTLALAAELADTWRDWPGDFAVVDEGPGLSGSSFASVASFLGGLGVADERIALFPSWETDGSGFVSPVARRQWDRHRRYVAEFEELGRFAEDRDLSAGAWRHFTGVRATIHVGHERRKYLRQGRLYKFAGYGRYGRALLERARALAEWIPRTYGLEDGFLISEWVPAWQPKMSTEFLDHVAAYLDFVRREFPSSAEPAPLAEMIAVNTGDSWPGDEPGCRPVALDGRMFPHEWLETGDGWLKADALEHHDDHFYPGPQDIAWDLAGFSIEHRLNRDAERYLLDRYTRLSGDRASARLPFYRAAYLAFRLGYCTLAGEPLQSERDRYSALLERESWTSKKSRLSA